MRTIKELEKMRLQLQEDDVQHSAVYDMIDEDIHNTFIKNAKPIGNIGNYLGGLSVSFNDGRYYWAIENYDGFSPQEISRELYDALLTFKTKEK